MKERSSQVLGNRRQLARCFQAWRGYILRKRTAARELYRQQLLRKGLGALQWAVQLRRVQMETAQRRHALAVLAVSFHRWKEAAVKRNESQTSQQEPVTLSQKSPIDLVRLGRSPAVTAPVWSRLAAGSSQEAMWPSRVEADLWRQLHRRQRADELCQRIQAIRDLRRLAAFRLWHLQKELLDKEEARVQEARALLEKKQLQSVFRAWRSRSLETERIWPLLSQIRRELAARCFRAWRQFVERKALCRHSLEHHRARSLRKCFQQWVLMLQRNEADKRTTMNLLILRQRIRRYGSASAFPSACGALQTGLRRWPLGKRGGSLDELYQRMTLQRIFLLWKARLCQQQQAE
uniref:Sfi1 spindle body domain-containing protein n=1 Tax=Pelodiscus sinensis TaxID=13735 RepID=K7FRB2_PELSI